MKTEQQLKPQLSEIFKNRLKQCENRFEQKKQRELDYLQNRGVKDQKSEMSAEDLFGAQPSQEDAASVKKDLDEESEDMDIVKRKRKIVKNSEMEKDEEMAPAKVTKKESE